MSKQRNHIPKDNAELNADEKTEGNTELKRVYAECVESLEKIKKDLNDSASQDLQEQEEPLQPHKGLLPVSERTSSVKERIPQTPELDEKDDISNDQKVWKWCSRYLIVFLVLIIAIFGGAWHKDLSPGKLNDFLKTSFTPGKSSHDKIIDELNELLKTPQFNENVPVYGLTIMKNAFKNALDDKEKAPVIVLLMATPEQNDLVRNISHQLANLIAAGRENSLPVTSLQINSKHSQSDIENLYQTTFQQQGKSVLLLENLEELDPRNAMVLHQFSDGENSVIHSTFTIVTLKYKQQVTVDFNASLKQLAEISTNELQSLWKPFWSNDNLDCVINRIAENTVVLLNK